MRGDTHRSVIFVLLAGLLASTLAVACAGGFGSRSGSADGEGGGTVKGHHPRAAAAEGGRGETRQAPSAALVAELRRTVEALAAVEPPRSSWNPESLDRARAIIEGKLSASRLDVKRQSYRAEDLTATNLIVRLGPARAPRFVVGAHYDVVAGSPGADDNASGVAVLLAVARRLDPSALRVRVELVAYTLEEPPFFRSGDMGSARHAARLVASGVPVQGMLSLESVGYFRSEPDSQALPPELPEAMRARPELRRGDFLAVVGRPQDAPLVEAFAAAGSSSPIDLRPFVVSPAVEGSGLSDHVNYQAVGIPAAMVTDTAYFRNPTYHTARDRPDLLSYDRMADLVEVLVRFLEGLEPQPPPR